VIKKEGEKIKKHEGLTIQILRMWDVKTEAIPVIIGTTGTISKSFRKYLSNIREKQNIKYCRQQSSWALHTYLRN
jgi:hypothetical protein